MRRRCPDCGGTGKAPKRLDLFSLGEPVCVTCQGQGRIELNRLALERVAEMRAEHCTYRRIAEVIHAEFDGDWQPPHAQWVGEILCDSAGVDRHQEFEEFCAWRRDLTDSERT